MNWDWPRHPEEDANVELKTGSKRIEEPAAGSVRRGNRLQKIGLRQLESKHRETYLVYSYICATTSFSRNALLISTYVDNAKSSRVDLLTTISDNADDHRLPVSQCLPRWVMIFMTPHDTCEEVVGLVVHGHDDCQFRSTGRTTLHLMGGGAIVLEVVRIVTL